MTPDLRAFSSVLDYPVICDWWERHSWTAIPLNHLPDTGLVVCAEGKPVCAAFLYFTGTAFCVLEFIVSDPDSDKNIRSECLDYLLESAKTLAKRQGAETIFTTADHKGLIARLQDHKFQVTDRDVTHLVARI